MKDEINTTAEEKLLTDYRHIITKYYTNSPLVQAIVDAIAKTNICSSCGGFGFEDYLIYGTSKVCDICDGRGLRPVK